MNDIRKNFLLLTFNIDDKSISFRVIDQNRTPLMKSLWQPMYGQTVQARK